MDDPPRYQPSRALPAYAYVPGRNPRPVATPAPSYSPEERWTDNAEYLWGVDLYNASYFWEAHEAWEGLWRAAAGRDEAQRRFLQGLIQCAAACLKAAAGDAPACRRLAVRALARLDEVHGEHGSGFVMGLDVGRFAADFRRFVDASPLAIADRPRLHLAAAPASARP